MAMVSSELSPLSVISGSTSPRSAKRAKCSWAVLGGVGEHDPAGRQTAARRGRGPDDENAPVRPDRRWSALSGPEPRAGSGGRNGNAGGRMEPGSGAGGRRRSPALGKSRRWGESVGTRLRWVGPRRSTVSLSALVSVGRLPSRRVGFRWPTLDRSAFGRPALVPLGRFGGPGCTGPDSPARFTWLGPARSGSVWLDLARSRSVSPDLALDRSRSTWLGLVGCGGGAVGLILSARFKGLGRGALDFPGLLSGRTLSDYGSRAIWLRAR